MLTLKRKKFGHSPSAEVGLFMAIPIGILFYPLLLVFMGIGWQAEAPLKYLWFDAFHDIFPGISLGDYIAFFTLAVLFVLYLLITPIVYQVLKRKERARLL